MRNTWTICRRELGAYFSSPVGYVAIAFITLVNSYFFWLICRELRVASMQPLMGNMAVTLMLVLPALSMRLFAEEKKTGTIELLMTAPVTDTEVVVGKYAASIAVYAVLLLISGMYPVFLLKYGDPDVGPILSGYLGLFLLGGAYLALGIFVSTLTRNQIITFVVTFGLLLVIYFLDVPARSVTSETTRELLSYLSLTNHFFEMVRGVVDLKDVVYYLSFVAFFLFLTVRSVETRKWK